jgi:N-formylglutamate amidohydrolase
MEASVTYPGSDMPGALWSLDRGRSPIIGTAIHNGHQVWPHLAATMALGDEGRRREEDPFTAETIRDVPNRLVVHRSRFEVDLNRAPEEAVYMRPEQSWGLTVWREVPAGGMLAALLREHADYYALLRHVLSEMAAEHGRFVLLDMHSYNHRRAGPEAPPTPQEAAPDVNIGTFSMDRDRWAHVLDPFIDCLREQRVRGRPLDVRENVAFEGRGEQTRFVHRHFPQTGCAIAVELKKIFMDEWTGAPDPAAVAELRAAVRASLPVLEAALGALP